MKILHIITNDKFTIGYINFMKRYMKKYEHSFLISIYNYSGETGKRSDLIDEENVEYYSDSKWLAFGGKVRQMVREADKIIVSGVFGVEMMIFFWPQYAFNKMYLQYWGGDFYQVREKIKFGDWRRWIQRRMLLSCFKRSYGAIYLIEGEYEKYKDITGIQKKHVYVAGVPGDPQKKYDYTPYRKNVYNGLLKIVVGNSATNENHHKEIFGKLAHLKDEEIEIYCPLSYGDDRYRDEIISYGVNVFGKKFHAITEWMKLKDYNQFLADCQVGIFNNDRQQAMGNIFAMLQMGRKVYLRTDTSMFKNYQKKGFVIYDVNELDNITMKEITDFPERDRNIQVAETWDYIQDNISEWRNIFNGNQLFDK